MSSAKKRKATTSNGENMQKALNGLCRLSSAEKHSILETLVRDPLQDATNVIIKKTQTLDEKPLTDQLLKEFGSRANSAIHQLDGLRCSQQFERVGDVSRDLCALIKEAKRYSPCVRFSVLCRIAGVFSHSVDTGEVFKGISSCGGIQGDLCSDMLEALDEMGDGGDVQLQDAKAQLERVHSRLADYGIDEFEEVIEMLDSKLSESDSEPESDD